MVMRNVLVALRDADDLEEVSSYLNKIKAGEVRRLWVAYLKLSQDCSDKLGVKFDQLSITRDRCAKSLKGFDFELVEINYSGDRLPASAYSDEAVKRRCDTILVVGEQRKPYFSANLASSLAVESPIAVNVIKS